MIHHFAKSKVDQVCRVLVTVWLSKVWPAEHCWHSQHVCWTLVLEPTSAQVKICRFDSLGWSISWLWIKTFSPLSSKVIHFYITITNVLFHFVNINKWCNCFSANEAVNLIKPYSSRKNSNSTYILYHHKYWCSESKLICMWYNIYILQDVPGSFICFTSIE